MKPISSYRSRALQGEVSEGPKSKHQIKAEKQARKTLSNRARTAARKAVVLTPAADNKPDLAPLSPNSPLVAAFSTSTRIDSLRSTSSDGAPSLMSPSLSGSDTSSLESAPRPPVAVLNDAAPAASYGAAQGTHDLAPGAVSGLAAPVPRRAPAPAPVNLHAQPVNVPVLPAAAAPQTTARTPRTGPPRAGFSARITGLFQRARASLASVGTWLRDAATSLWDTVRSSWARPSA